MLDKDATSFDDCLKDEFTLLALIWLSIFRVTGLGEEAANNLGRL